MIIKCSNCSKEFKKRNPDYNVAIKRGQTNFFCSLSCCGIYNTKHGKYSLCSNNRADKYTNFKYLYKCLLNPARKTCNITIEDLYNQWEKQKGICPYTGIPLKLQTHTNYKLSNFKDWYCYGSVDRIDSSKDYQVGNIEIISVAVNFLKNKFSKESVQSFLLLIGRNNGFEPIQGDPQSPVLPLHQNLHVVPIRGIEPTIFEFKARHISRYVKLE